MSLPEQYYTWDGELVESTTLEANQGEVLYKESLCISPADQFLCDGCIDSKEIIGKKTIFS